MRIRKVEIIALAIVLAAALAANMDAFAAQRGGILYYKYPRSLATQDGWVLESSETSNKGETINSNATTIIVGDDKADRQYRSILHFNTGVVLPDNAVVDSVAVKVKWQSTTGQNPFPTHGVLVVDIRRPYFSTSVNLQKTDWQAAGITNVGQFIEKPDANGWYTAHLRSVSFPYISLTGATQLRLRFSLGDNDDLGTDFLKFYSGNYTTIPSFRPMLVIAYHQVYYDTAPTP